MKIYVVIDIERHTDINIKLGTADKEEAQKEAVKRAREYTDDPELGWYPSGGGSLIGAVMDKESEDCYIEIHEFEVEKVIHVTMALDPLMEGIPVSSKATDSSSAGWE